jgi:hypothetical protein
MTQRHDDPVFVRAAGFITWGVGLLVIGYIWSLATAGRMMVSSAFIGGVGIIMVCSSIVWWCKKQRK